MQISQLEAGGGAVLLEVSGDLRSTENPLTNKLDELFGAGVTKIIISFDPHSSTLSHAACMGLVRTCALLEREGAKLGLLNRPRLAEGYDTWDQICQCIPLFPNKEQALASFES